MCGDYCSGHKKSFTYRFIRFNALPENRPDTNNFELAYSNYEPGSAQYHSCSLAIWRTETACVEISLGRRFKPIRFRNTGWLSRKISPLQRQSCSPGIAGNCGVQSPPNLWSGHYPKDSHSAAKFEFTLNPIQATAIAKRDRRIAAKSPKRKSDCKN